MSHPNSVTDYGLPADMDPEEWALEQTLASIETCGQIMPTAASSLPESLDLDVLMNTEPEALDFVLPGLLVGTVGAMVSMGGLGKSFWALQAAATVATPGFDPLRLKPARHGKAMVLTLEDPNVVLHQRIHALMKRVPDKKRSTVAANLTVIPAIGTPLDLLDDRFIEDLVRKAKGYRLIVIDTLSRIHSIDENKASDAARLVGRMEQLAQRTQAAVLYVHHVSKASAMTGMADTQQAPRGSSVLVDNCRWQAFLAAMTPQEAKAFGINPADRHGYIRWNVSKQNYAASQADRWLHRTDTGFFEPVNLRGHAVPETVSPIPVEPDLRDPTEVIAAHAQRTGYPLKAPF